jgi:membrane protein DedA with SNARE-associated domain
MTKKDQKPLVVKRFYLNSMEIIANSILNLLSEHRYIFSFLGALFEGTYIMILTGVLFKFGYFKFWGLITVLTAGYFLNGVGFYLIGRIGGHRVLEKWGKRLHITRKLLEKLEEYFKKHSIKTLFITRITYGLSIPTFIIAGSFKMKWKKFIVVNLVAAIVWILGMVGLGYVFGVSYKALGVVTKTVSIGLVIALFVIIVLFSILIIYWLRKFAKTKFIKGLENHRFMFLRGVGTVISKLVNNKSK